MGDHKLVPVDPTEAMIDAATRRQDHGNTSMYESIYRAMIAAAPVVTPSPDVEPAEVEALERAAQAVIDRWVTPLWKDVPATAVFINELHNALAAIRASGRIGERPVGKIVDQPGEQYADASMGAARKAGVRTPRREEVEAALDRYFEPWAFDELRADLLALFDAKQPERDS